MLGPFVHMYVCVCRTYGSHVASMITSANYSAHPYLELSWRLHIRLGLHGCPIACRHARACAHVMLDLVRWEDGREFRIKPLRPCASYLKASGGGLEWIWGVGSSSLGFRV